MRGVALVRVAGLLGCSSTGGTLTEKAQQKMLGRKTYWRAWARRYKERPLLTCGGGGL